MLNFLWSNKSNVSMFLINGLKLLGLLFDEELSVSIFFRSIDSARIFRECVSLDLVYLLRWSDQFKTVVQINTKWTIIYTFIATIWTYDFVSYVLLRAFC